MYNKDLVTTVVVAVVLAALLAFATGYFLGHQSSLPE